GSFTVNGVTINYDTTVDTINGGGPTDIVNRINTNVNLNGSVTASFDPVTQRFFITSNTVPARLVNVADVTGNFTSFMQLQDNLTQIEAAQKFILSNLSVTGNSENRLDQVKGTLQTQQLAFTKTISGL